MEWYGSPIRMKSTGPGNQIVVYAYQICSVTHNDHHKSIIIACSKELCLKEYYFLSDFQQFVTRSCEYEEECWVQGPGWHSLFLLLLLCVYPITARRAEREQSSITTKLSSSGQGQTQSEGMLWLFVLSVTDSVTLAQTQHTIQTAGHWRNSHHVGKKLFVHV